MPLRSTLFVRNASSRELMKSPSRWASPIRSRPLNRPTSVRFLGSEALIGQPCRARLGPLPSLFGVAERDSRLECHHRCELALGVEDFKPAGKVQYLAGAHFLRRHLAGGLDGFLLGGPEIGEAFALLVLGAPASLVNVDEVDGHAANYRTISTRRPLMPRPACRLAGGAAWATVFAVAQSRRF